MTVLSTTNYSEDMILNEFSANLKQIHKENQLLKANIQIPKKEAKLLIDIIKAGGNGRLPFVVLGKADLRVDEKRVRNFGTMAAHPSHSHQMIKEFFKALYPDMKGKALQAAILEHLTRGAIMNEEQWYPFKNDCFIYGAINNGKEFHLGIKKRDIKVDHLWSKADKRPTTLGREIIMAMKSGYESHDTKNGMVFMPPCEVNDKSRAATISQYRDVIQGFQSGEEILALL